MATPPPSAALPPHPGPAPSRPAWQRNLPNALTLARLAMTVAFVAILSVYRFPDTNTWALPTALILFIVAALTDALDGYLARRWNAVSVFGRIMDPFADKILILGAFVMLAGPQFWIDAAIVTPDAEAHYHGQVTGVASWMVVVILSRELLVTTIRAVLESRGVDFSASLSGKLKMIAQSVGVPAILLTSMTALGGIAEGVNTPSTGDMSHWESAKATLAQFGFGKLVAGWSSYIAWAVTLITALSAIPYITRAITALKPPRPS